VTTLLEQLQRLFRSQRRIDHRASILSSRLECNIVPVCARSHSSYARCP
jgi:hypothetical protein